jgi:hypothetical protein
MNYVVVRKDLVFQRWDDIAESAAISNADSFVLCLPEKEWRALVGTPTKTETFAEIEKAYIAKRGWKYDNQGSLYGK